MLYIAVVEKSFPFNIMKEEALSFKAIFVFFLPAPRPDQEYFMARSLVIRAIRNARAVALSSVHSILLAIDSTCRKMPSLQSVQLTWNIAHNILSRSLHNSIWKAKQLMRCFINFEQLLGRYQYKAMARGYNNKIR